MHVFEAPLSTNPAFAIVRHDAGVNLLLSTMTARRPYITHQFVEFDVSGLSNWTPGFLRRLVERVAQRILVFRGQHWRLTSQQLLEFCHHLSMALELPTLHQVQPELPAAVEERLVRIAEDSGDNAIVWKAKSKVNCQWLRRRLLEILKEVAPNARDNDQLSTEQLIRVHDKLLASIARAL